jgi:NADPH-dependent 2,4-dienoyl-CoA reductase/sulfur reductase-like enzyme
MEYREEAERRVECLVIGAGPAGLGAAITVAESGASVLLIDENSRPGGQLFKQIHKFFGSREHKAGTRGFIIGQHLLQEAENAGVEVWLNSRAWGMFPDNIVGISSGGKSLSVQADQIVVATGAVENALAFPGSTLPGVITAGAAQTFTNIHRVLPGRRVLMVGTGNVGLIVSYQLLQAGAEVVEVIDAAPLVGGYDVHANKLRRASIPITLSTTVKGAAGSSGVEAAEIVSLDQDYAPVSGTERTLEVDTICLAVGLSPRIDLLQSSHCATMFSPCLGGHVPLHDQQMMVRSGLYVAGDVAGIEEASTALEEGRLAGTAVVRALGYGDTLEVDNEEAGIFGRLLRLRSGRFGEKRRISKEEIVGACGGGYTF